MEAHRHDHNHDHHHDHHHDRATSGLRLSEAAPTRSVYRVGRRRFLTELGRNTFAVAILGGAIAACGSESNDDVGQTPSPGSAPTSPSDVNDTNSLRWAQTRLGSVSAYVLVRGNQAAVVDTGTPGSADQIGETLATLGVTYDDVRHVVLTHHHGDHIGSLPTILERATAATTYAGELDIATIAAPGEMEAIGDGDDVFGLEVINTPGHTPGSIAVIDHGIGLLIAGDALNGNEDGTEITGPNELYTTDMDAGRDSVTKLAGFEFEAAAFGHGNPFEGGAGAAVSELATNI